MINLPSIQLHSLQDLEEGPNTQGSYFLMELSTSRFLFQYILSSFNIFSSENMNMECSILTIMTM